MFKNNPEAFSSRVVKLVNEQKATMIVDHISYDETNGTYDSAVFTAEKSIERRLAEDLDAAEEVSVYAKLPKGLDIPTLAGRTGRSPLMRAV